LPFRKGGESYLKEDLLELIISGLEEKKNITLLCEGFIILEKGLDLPSTKKNGF